MNADWKPTENTRRIFTIGHSNHPIVTFLELLKTHEVEVLVDVRSHPHSKFAPQFDMARLRAACNEAGIIYLHMGAELGGRPRGEEFYDDKGHVSYARLSESSSFKAGIDRLLNGIDSHRIAIACSEEDPQFCHRRLLVGRVLATYGVSLWHIRGDKRVDFEKEVRLEYQGKMPENQSLLFESQEAEIWKSTRSVLQRGRRQSSSEP